MSKERLIDFSLYEIRRDGTVISKFNNKPMKLHTLPRGYVINTYKQINGKPGKFYRHRVIWHYFNGDIPDDKQIDHIDGNKLNNSISNLRCVSPSQNMRNPNTYYRLLESLRSDERRRKISEANTGKIVSEEQKIKQSIAMSGTNHPFYGKKRPDHSARMSKARRDKLGRFI